MTATRSALKPELSHTLAGFDLNECNYVGRVLFPAEPDRSIENRFFAGWQNLLSPALQRLAKQKTSSTLQFVTIEGNRLRVIGS